MSPNHARPFPGLRSFTEDEAHLFFGREGQSDGVIRLLEHSGFVAVVGTSGCGKSSLLRAGVLPSLLAGYAVSAGSAWQIAECRPSNDPIGRVALALGRRLRKQDGSSEWLRRGSASIAEAVRAARTAGTLEPDENVLIFVDQFEELFRYQVHQENLTADRDEKAEFVALLLAAIQNRDDRIFVALTMRSDFLGDCARFRDLPETINRNQYLVPRMTRVERRLAIEGPIRVAGAAIAPRLVQRLLNELGDEDDQLPVLQHALMRTWDSWIAREPRPSCIDFDDYEKIGSVRDALGRHAQETLEDVSTMLAGGDVIVKRIFQRLRVRDANGRETRSPAIVRDLAAISAAPLVDVQKALDAFRDDTNGRTFLVPFTSSMAVLDAGTQIDVTHESLLRCWPLLAGDWVREEEEARRTYTRLASRAEEEGDPPQNLLRGTLLQRAAEWWDERKPNRVWAERYHPGFDAAAKYLALSRSLAKTEAEREEEEQREAEERRIRDARREAEVRAEIHESKLKKQMAYAALVLSLIAVGVVLKFFFASRSAEADSRRAETGAKAAREDAVVQLLATKSALAAHEGGASLVPSLLLAAESLRRKPTADAHSLVTSALAVVAPVEPFPVATAIDAAFGEPEGEPAPDLDSEPSKGGRVLAVLREDRVVELWDVEEKASLGTLGRDIEAFSLARRAARAVTASADGPLTVWNVKSRAALAELSCSGRSGKPRISDDGTAVAALCGGRLHSWTTTNDWARARRLIREGAEKWTHFALGGDGRLVAVASLEAGRSSNADDAEPDLPRVEVRELATGKRVAEVLFIFGVTSIELLDGPVLALADGTGTIRLWDIDPSRQADLGDENARTTLRANSGVTALSQGVDGESLMAGSRGGVATVWNGAEEVAVLIGSSSLQSVALTSDRDLALIIDRNRRVEFFNLGGMHDNLPTTARLISAQFVPDGSLGVLRSTAFTRLLEVAGRHLSNPWNPRRDGFAPVALAPDKRAIVVRPGREAPSATVPLSVREFSDTRTIGRELWAERVQPEGSLGLPAFSSDSKHIAGYVRRIADPDADDRRSVRLGLFVWNAGSGAEEFFRPADNPRSMLAAGFCFIGGDRLIVGLAKGIREIVVSEKKEFESALKVNGPVRAIACSPQGSMVAIAEAPGGTPDPGGDDGGSTGRRVRLLEFPSGREVRSVEHLGVVSDMKFDNSGRYLTIVDADGVSLLEVAGVARPVRYPLRTRPLTAMLSADGQFVVAHWRGVTYLRWKPEDLIREACRRARRDLSQQEWESYMGGESFPATCAQVTK